MSKKRLDYDNRINLQAGIAKGYSLRRIAEILNKSRSTIYREIINNCYYKDCRHTCAHCQLTCTDRSHYRIVEKCLFIYRYVIIYIISVFSVLKVCCISHYIAYNLYEREIIMVEDNSSYGGGFALGFLLGIIGLLIALAVGTSGSNIRRGAGHGLLTYIIVCVVGFIFLVATAGSGY